MAPKAVPLADHVDILRLHEDAYWDEKGDARAKVLEKIIEDIASQGKLKLKGPEKELKQVSLELHQ